MEHIKLKDDIYKKSYIYTADSETVFKRSSGGAFSAIYGYYLERDYVIWGVRYDDNLKVVHDFATTSEQCELFRKSKYVQSNPNDLFVQIAMQLNEGKKVLFSGTPCQCAALSNYLDVNQHSHEQVVTVSVLCHGVSNQTIFDEHLRCRESRNRRKIVDYIFRYKSYKRGKYNSRCAEIVFEDGTTCVVNRKNDAYLKGYYSRLFFRPSCGTCHFTSDKRVSDYTIGDAWGINSVNKKMDPLKGVSLVITNATDAPQLVEYMSKNGYIKEVSNNWVLNSQKILKHPTEFHKNRELFFELRKTIEIDAAVMKATHKPIWRKAGDRLSYYIKRIRK